MDYSPWDHKELDTAEWLSLHIKARNPKASYQQVWFLLRGSLLGFDLWMAIFFWVSSHCLPLCFLGLNFLFLQGQQPYWIRAQNFPCGSAGKETACSAGDLGSIPGLGKSPGEGKGYPLVFWPREFHGLYSPWGHKESNMTEWLSLSLLLSWLCDQPLILVQGPTDYSPPGSSVHGITQARIVDFRRSSRPTYGICSPASPALSGRFFTTESAGKP